MTDWRKLDEALDDAAMRGEVISFWWRDDDAGEGSPALTRLLDMAERQNVPLALAVVPAWLQAEAQGEIAARADITVLQHGFAHANHARKRQKSIELGGRRAAGPITRQLKKGFALLQDAFGAGFLPVLVPPWNRIGSDLHSHLSDGGYRGLSVFGRRHDPEIAPGVSLINTHLDPIDWRGTRGFLGEDVMIEGLVDVLDADEPIGILSHHLVMDEPSWAFLERLFSTLNRHPAARLCTPSSLFSSSGMASGDAA